MKHAALVFFAGIVCLYLSVYGIPALADAHAETIALRYHGVLSQGGILVGKTNAEYSVELDGVAVDVNPEGYFVFGFGRDARPGATLTISDGAGNVRTESLSIDQREYNIQRIEGVPAKTVTPDESSLARIVEETRLVKAARKHILPRNDFLSAFAVPVEGRITGVYGSQRIYNGVPKRPHFGIDYAAPLGTPVYAPAPGVVTLTHDDMYYSGGTLIVDHGYGLSSTFIHLNDILVKEGDEIAKGQMIARVGQGGRSTGPHLDWRMNWLDQRIDPALVIQLSLPEGF